MAITQQTISKALDWAYEKAVTGGIPGTRMLTSWRRSFRKEKENYEIRLTRSSGGKTRKVQLPVFSPVSAELSHYQ